MNQKKKIRIIILEGVTTVGKTTVFCNLQRYSKEHGFKWLFIPESETIMPIIDSVNQKFNNEHFKDLFKNKFCKNADLYIFDRLHFSSIFKTGAKAKDLEEIEKILYKFNTQIFMLYVQKDFLRKRIEESMEYRDVKWNNYFLDKVDGHKEKIADIFIRRQSLIKKMMCRSMLRTHILDSSDQNFVRITRQIIDIINYKITN
jgi:thymidylate kinase